MDKLFLDRVAVWREKSGEGLSVKVMPSGRVYFENNVAKVADGRSFRYAKNYSKGRGEKAVKFCLIMTSLSDSEAEIEAFLDKIAEKLNAATIEKCLENDFEINYIDEYYGRGE